MAKRRNRNDAKVERGHQQLAEDQKQKQFENDWNLKWFKPKGLQLDCVESLDYNTFTIIDAPSGCVDKDTEFLSESGWKPISDYSDNEKVLQVDGNLQGSFVTPLRYIKLPCAEFNVLKSQRGVDQWLCDEHEVVYKYRDRKRLLKINIIEAIEKHKSNSCGFGGMFPKYYELPMSKSFHLTDNQIRLGVAVKADGYLSTESTGYYVVRLKKRRKIERLENLLNLNNKDFKLRVEDSGFHVFSFYAPEYSKSLYEWMFCPKWVSKIILDEVGYWDGTLSDERLVRFSTTSKEDADAFQYFANTCGYKADIITNDRTGQLYKNNQYTRKSVEYIVQTSSQTYNNLLPEKVEIKREVSVDGFKYCFTVPSGMLVFRRNGKIFVTGNCGKTTTALWCGLQSLKNRESSQLIFIKNPTEVGDDKIGFLSGDEQDKLQAHMDTTKRIFHTFMHKNKLEADMSKDKIRLTIPNFVLGSTWDNAFIILDEAQLMSPATIKLLLERCGKNTTYAILGDSGQRYAVSKRNDGFADLIERVSVPVPHTTSVRASKYPHDFGYIRMSRHDNQRSEGSKLINLIYEEEE